MPYKDLAQQREYQRQWMANQRAVFFAGKSCVDCGSAEDLELDHLDKTTKADHRVWSWSSKRRQAELEKCVVRCDACHNERHAAERRQDHGVGAYKRGCRCQVCRDAKAEKERRWRERRGRDLHARTRLCRPLPNSSATPPQPLTLFDLSEAA